MYFFTWIKDLLKDAAEAILSVILTVALFSNPWIDPMVYLNQLGGLAVAVGPAVIMLVERGAKLKKV